MAKIKSKLELEKTKVLFKKKLEKIEHTIYFCSGAGCISSGSEEVKKELINQLKLNKLTNKIRINSTGCIGVCDVGPVMIIQPEGIMYCKLKPEDMVAVVKKYLMKGKILEDLCYYDKVKKIKVPFIKDIEFLKKQDKFVLKNCGKIDVSDINEYIFYDGYHALNKVLTSMTKNQVIEEIKKAGLRGRGGGGFPTGIKWELTEKMSEKQKYIICNADEGDPGAFMDRSLLEGDPHLIIEGMIIGGFAIGADKGFVYVRAEYPLAIERLQNAIDQAKKIGILGKNIFSSKFNFDLEVRIGAGAFVCGEETALIASIEGKRGEPRQKPPYPAEKGLFGKPTVINNVETFGNISGIILYGSSSFRKRGVKKSPGTKIFALAGDINNTGLIEVPMGISLGKVIYEIGGGIPNNKKFKVAQTGGPSGGCLTSKDLNAEIDYDSLVERGAIMGSGGLICMDEDSCMVDVAKYFMEFVQEESCGKCVPCRLGTKRMLEILERITQGNGKEGDIELLIEMGEIIKKTALCGLGQTAPNPVLSTIKNFRHEYEEHIKEKYCRAGVCSDLFVSPCENACPSNVNVPGYISLIAAGQIKDAYHLIRQENPFPSVCGRVCTHPCESKCRRGQLDEPIAISDLKRYVADEILKSEEPFSDLIFPAKNKKVAVIGAGPSGLTCGYYLARLGYKVTVFEEQPVAGGMLAYGIPEYRLPKKELEKEIETIKQVGLNIELNTKVGRDISFETLKEKYDSVYIAVGTQLSKKVGIEGEHLKGVYHGLDFLKDVNLGKEIDLKGNVIVIGGGNTAIDAARVAVRLGAENVDIVYRRTEEDMPADKREIIEAKEEGIKIHTLFSPEKISLSKNSFSLKCSKMKVEGFSSDGRKRVVKVPKKSQVFKADLIIPAVSQTSDLPFVKKDEVEITEWGTFKTDDKTMMTSIDGVFAGGDIVRGPDTVIQAIADGKKAAESIDKFLGGKGVLNKGKKIDIPEPNIDSEIVEHERFKMKFIEPETRKTGFCEVSQGFHKLNAIAESMRCLRCDYKI
jgi:NADH-quinone oxidoreductase subunit F